MKIVFSKPAVPATGVYVVFALNGNKLLQSGEKLDKAAKGALAGALKSANFKAKRGEILDVYGLAGHPGRIAVVGLGGADELTEQNSEGLGGSIIAKFLTSGEKTLTLALDDVPGAKVSADTLAARIAYGIQLRSYRFDRYRTKESADKKPSVAKVVIGTAASTKADHAYASLSSVADAVRFARDLVSEPGNVLHPESYAREIKKLAKLGLKIEVLGERDMQTLGMGALLGVGQGSAKESQLVIMQWNGLKGSKTPPVAFIGKGVTFDSGGISLKPGAGMEEMKFDMAGSAAVVGLMQSLATRKAKVNAVGVVALVENMPSHDAQRPGDIVKSMSGQTIEVHNTDAEGRLILADALWYTQNRFKPKFMIDLATLTGAILIALGQEHAGIFSNNDELAERLTKAGVAENEAVWRLPLSEAHDKAIDSTIADMKNISGSRNAGSIVGAQFLQRFVNNVPWVHIDIAGTAWIYKDKATCPSGATGYGVRLLDRLVADYYEDK